MSEPRAVLPNGSWILITGITGFIGSHIAKQFLERGYKVRGTVRDAVKASWLLDDVFKAYAERGKIELAVVFDFTSDDVAFDNAIKGVSAIIHLATVVSMDPDPNKVIPQTVAATTSLLNAALNESSVQRFVYTTSYVAAAMPLVERDTTVDRDSWNDVAVQLAWSPPPYEPSRGFLVYMASKVAAEKVVWEFVKEKSPHFVVNAVSPSAAIGQPLTYPHSVSGGAWMRHLFDGQTQALTMAYQSFFVDVKDIALLHVASTLDPNLKNLRLQAWGHRANWNDLLAILGRIRSNREFMADLPVTPHGSLSTDLTQALAILREWGGQNGWKPVDDTVADTISVFYDH